MIDTMKPTNKVADEDKLREIFSMDDDDPPFNTMEAIATHDGAWRYEAAIDKWRFWEHEDL